MEPIRFRKTCNGCSERRVCTAVTVRAGTIVLPSWYCEDCTEVATAGMLNGVNGLDSVSVDVA